MVQSADNQSLGEFVALMRRLRENLVGEQGSKYHDLATSYDVDSACDALTLFLERGEWEMFEAGVARLRRVVGRIGGDRQRQGERDLARLRVLAEETSGEGRAVVLRAVEGAEQETKGGRRSKAAFRADVLVVAALLDPELKAFIRHLEECEETIGSGEDGLPGVTYFRGFLRSENKPNDRIRVAALFQDQPGMIDCSAVVANGIRSFDPRVVALTGVCAGRRASGVKRLDLVVPSSVFTYDTGKHTPTEFKREPYWVEASPFLIRRVRAVGDSVLKRIASEIGRTNPEKTSTPTIHTEVMACGSAVVDRPEILAEIARTNRKVVGLDMESFAALRATKLTDTRIQALVVKGVMDFAQRKSDSHKLKAAFWAGTFLARFLIEDFPQTWPRLAAGNSQSD